MHPEETPTTTLRPGQVGFVACNMKESSEGNVAIIIWTHLVTLWLAHIGDTLHRVGAPVDPMPGFKPAKAMVCICFYVLPFCADSVAWIRCMLVCIRSTAAISPSLRNPSNEYVNLLLEICSSSDRNF